MAYLLLSLKSWIMQLQKHNCTIRVLCFPSKSLPKKHFWSLNFLQLDTKAQETRNKTAKLEFSRNAKMTLSTLLSAFHKLLIKRPNYLILSRRECDRKNLTLCTCSCLRAVNHASIRITQTQQRRNLTTLLGPGDGRQHQQR